MSRFRISVVLSFLFLAPLAPYSWSQSSSTKIYDKDGLLGLETEDGKELVPARYERIGWSETEGSDFNTSVIGYLSNGSWGLLAENGKIITPPKYSSLNPSDIEGLFIAAIKGPLSKRHIFGVVNATGKTAIPFEYSYLDLREKVAIAQTLDGNLGYYGLISHSNQTILPFEYLAIKPLGNQLYSISRRNGKISLIDDKGQELFGYELDSIIPTNDWVFEIFQGAKMGLVSSKGELLIKPQFKDYEFSSNDLALSYLQFNNWSVLSDKYEVLIELTADSLIQREKKFIISLNGNHILLDQNFESQSKAYEQLIPVTNRFLKSKSENGFGVLNMDGKEILSNQFVDIKIDGRFIYALKNKWHVYDTVGMLRTSYGYDSLKIFSEGRLAVKRNNNWGFIDSSLKEVIPCIFSNVTGFENGMSKVQFHREEGVIDKKGDWLILPGEKEITLINDRIYLEKTKRQTRLKSFENDLIYFTDNPLELKEDYLLEKIDSITNWAISLYGTILSTTAALNNPPIRYYDSLSIIDRDGMLGVISDRGSIHIPFGKYEDISTPTEGLQAIKKDGYYGFVDNHDKLRIANRYEAVGNFTEGLVAVKIRGKWGFINKKEELVCQPVYDEVTAFQNGISIVGQDGKYLVINNEGKRVQSQPFSSIQRLKTGNLKVESNGNFGLLDSSGRTIIQPRYQGLQEISEGEILVQRKDKYGVLDQNGVNKLPIIYDQIIYLENRSEYLVMTVGTWQTISLSPGALK